MRMLKFTRTEAFLPASEMRNGGPREVGGTVKYLPAEPVYLRSDCIIGMEAIKGGTSLMVSSGMYHSTHTVSETPEQILNMLVPAASHYCDKNTD